MPRPKYHGRIRGLVKPRLLETLICVHAAERLFRVPSPCFNVHNLWHHARRAHLKSFVGLFCSTGTLSRSYAPLHIVCVSRPDRRRGNLEKIDRFVVVLAAVLVPIIWCGLHEKKVCRICMIVEIDSCTTAIRRSDVMLAKIILSANSRLWSFRKHGAQVSGAALSESSQSEQRAFSGQIVSDRSTISPVPKGNWNVLSKPRNSCHAP